MKRKLKRLVPVLFLIYLALLVWIILLKLQFSLQDLDTGRSVNLIPFYYDKEIGTAFHLKEVLENLLIFVPMGIYLQMLLPKRRLHTKLISLFLPDNFSSIPLVNQGLFLKESSICHDDSSLWKYIPA